MIPTRQNHEMNLVVLLLLIIIVELGFLIF